MNEKDLVLSAKWKYPGPVDPSKTIETLIQKKEIGVPARTLLLEAGYGAKQVEEMLDEQRTQAANIAESMQTNFDSGRLN